MPIFWKNSSSKAQEAADRRAEAMRELEKRRGRSATYTQPLLGSGIHTTGTATVEQQEDIRAFLTEFYGRLVFDYAAADMRQLLSMYPDTIGTHYALLVPDACSFDQFWARYYYRCSVTTILSEWQQRDDQQAALREAVTRQLVPTIQTKFLKEEIERGLGSRGARVVTPTTTTAKATRTAAQAISNSITGEGGSDSSYDDNSSQYEQQMLVVMEERMAARANMFHAEAVSDIVETIAEHGADGSDDEENDHNNSAIGIGFAESG